jgi:predicted transport protein
MNNKFLESTETFLRALRVSPPPPESFDTIHNIMDTIKEYREYIDPNPASWNKYVTDVFQLLGFNTKNELKRLILLSELGSVRSKRAVIVPIRFDESFNEIVSGLEWSTFLFFAMNFFQVEWGMLTDGQQIKIFNRNHNMKEFYLDVDLETILMNGNFDDFFAFYNVISLIRGGPTKATAKTSRKTKRHTKRYDLNYHMANKSNTVITLFDVLRAKIRSLSNRIDERFNKMYIGYYTHKSFCQIRPQRDQLKIWINLDIHQVSDPQALCRDVSNIGHHGMGNTEIILRSFNDLDAVFDLIRQAYNKSNDHAQKIQRNSGPQSRHGLRKAFWTELLEKASQKTSLHSRISPGKENWIGTGAGKSGLSYNYVIRMNDAQVELYIDNGDQVWNKSTFGYFFQQKENIEKNFGAALDWQRLEDKRASRIRYVIYDSGLKDQAYWSKLQELLVDAMIRLQQTFQPLIAQMD